MGSLWWDRVICGSIPRNSSNLRWFNDYIMPTCGDLWSAGVSRNTAPAAPSAPAPQQPPKWVYFEYWNKTVFVALLVSVPSVVQLNKLNRPTMRRAAAANRTSESDRRPTGLPRLRSAVADYAASACITGPITITNRWPKLLRLKSPIGDTSHRKFDHRFKDIIYLKRLKST